MHVFRVAQHLSKTVNEIELTMPYSELIEWGAFWKIEAEKHGRN